MDGDSGIAPGDGQGASDHRAVIGGMADVMAGGVIAEYMDAQAAELRQVVETERIDDGIIATLNEKLLFNFNSADLEPQSRRSLKKLAAVFKKYDKTNLTVTGHTDNLGPAGYNIQLSERRAKAVADYLVNLGVPHERVRIMGFGVERPVADNGTAEGRARNRRVEIHIAPNETLRKESQSQRG